MRTRSFSLAIVALVFGATASGCAPSIPTSPSLSSYALHDGLTRGSRHVSRSAKTEPLDLILVESHEGSLIHEYSLNQLGSQPIRTFKKAEELIGVDSMGNSYFNKLGGFQCWVPCYMEVYNVQGKLVHRVLLTRPPEGDDELAFTDLSVDRSGSIYGVVNLNNHFEIWQFAAGATGTPKPIRTLSLNLEAYRQRLSYPSLPDRCRRGWAALFPRKP